MQESPIAKSIVSEKIVCISVSSDGKYIAAGAPSGKAYLWLATTGELLSCWEAHFKPLKAICFSDEPLSSRFIVTAGEDGLTHVWSLATLISHLSASIYSDTPRSKSHSSPFFTINQHTLPVTDLHFSSGRLVTASLDRTCRVWDLYFQPEPRQEVSVVFPSMIVVSLLSPSHQYLYAGAADGKIFSSPSNLSFSVLAGPTAPHTTSSFFQGHNKAIASLSLSIDEKLLVSASLDGSAIVWDVHSKQSLRKLHNNPISSSFHTTALLLLPRNVFVNSHTSAATENLLETTGTIVPNHHPLSAVGTTIPPIGLFQKLLGSGSNVASYVTVPLREQPIASETVSDFDHLDDPLLVGDEWQPPAAFTLGRLRSDIRSLLSHSCGPLDSLAPAEAAQSYELIELKQQLSEQKQINTKLKEAVENLMKISQARIS